MSYLPYLSFLSLAIFMWRWYRPGTVLMKYTFLCQLISPELYDLTLLGDICKINSSILIDIEGQSLNIRLTLCTGTKIILPGLNYISLPLRSSSESNCTYLAKSKESHSLMQEMGLEAITELSQDSLIKASYRAVIRKESRQMREAMTENRHHRYNNTGRGDLLPYTLRTNSMQDCVVYL